MKNLSDPVNSTPASAVSDLQIKSGWRRTRNWALGLVVLVWVTVLVGVVINNMLSYPWEGFSYTVGEVEVVSSREWENIGGGKRLAGPVRALGLVVVALHVIHRVVKPQGQRHGVGLL